MNVTCKRLLSWLVVLTMVLSMVPVFDLSNFAVTTKAAENPAKDTLTAIEALRDTFATAAETNAKASAICPVCGGEEAVEWTALSGATAQLANPNGHYYLSGAVTFEANGTTYNANNNKLCLNLNGHNITAGGIALNISLGNTINVMDSAENDGTVKGVAGQYYGAAINVDNANAVCNIYGGTFMKNTCAGSVVNIRNNNGGTINMYAGTINASDATNTNWASTISLMGNSKTVFNLYGGTVKCGTLTAGGVQYRANIMLGYGNVAATFNMMGGTVVGGTYTGAATGGGATFAVVMGSTLKISGGTVYGGKFGENSGTLGANIFSLSGGAGTVEISGGTIVGDIYTRNAVDVKLSGAPQIVTSLKLENGETVNATHGFELSGISNDKLVDISELSADANIVVTGAKNKVFTVGSENAANVKECFSHTTANLDVLVNGSNQLYIGDKQAEVGTFDPWNCVDNAAYCEACTKQQETPVLVKNWTALSDGSTTTGLATGHYYLAGNMTQQITRTSGATVCLELNGMDLTVKNKVFGNMNTAGTMNIMDRAGKATVAGWQETYTGEVLDLRSNAAYVNIYGGTFTKHVNASTKGSIIYFHTGGNVNMYGGTIDASGVENSGYSPSVHMVGAANNVATFNMYDGEIKGGATGNTAGGNICVGAGTANTAVFNLYGGTVSGGSSKNVGGNFYVNAGQLNIDGGTVEGGISTGSYSAAAGGAKLGGGNIALGNGGKLNLISGTISGGKATNACGGNIYVRDNTTGKIEISGGKIINGTAKVDGNNICVYSSAEGSELKISGGEIGGGINATAVTAVTLSGAPTIKTSVDGQIEEATTGLEVTNDSNINVEGLTGDMTGNIQVTGEVGVAFATSDKAAEVVKYFDTTDAETKVVVEKKQLKIYKAEVQVPEEGVFAPELCDGRAYCQHCGTIQDWVPFEKGGSLTGHVYLTQAVTDESTSGSNGFITPNGTLCFNLNGYDLTTTNGRAFCANITNGTLNVMNIGKTEGTVTGAASNAGAVFLLNGGNGSTKINIYGGTFKQATVEGSVSTAIVYFAGNGGTVNMYGGLIDASNVTSGTQPTAIYMQGGQEGTTNFAAPAVFQMHGGEIKGNGSDLIKLSGVAAAEFTANGGSKITNGTVAVNNGNTVTVSNAEVDVIAMQAGHEEILTRVTLSGEAKVNHLSIGEGTKVNIDGLTAGANVVISGELGAKLIVAENAEALKGYVTPYYEYYYVDIEDNAFVLRVSEAAVVTAGEDGTAVKQYYPNVDDAVTAAAQGGYVELQVTGLTINLNGKNAYIDNRGHVATVTGGGTLYAMDWANDDYAGNGTFRVEAGVNVVTDVINPVNGNRYIVIKNEDGSYGAHRIQMYLTGISLRPSAAGLYYKANYKCDEVLAGLITQYGIVYNAVSANEILNFSDKDNVESIITGFRGNWDETAKTVSGTSSLIYGIFKDNGRTNEENTRYGETPINATPYIKIGEQVVLANVADTAHNEAYRANNGAIHKAMSMYDVLEKMNADAQWARYTEAQKASLHKFYNDWAGYGMSAWADDISNIVEYVAPETEA